MVEPASVATNPNARFGAVFARVIGRTEGGFVDDAADHGGATSGGLSLRFLQAEARIDPGLIADLKIGHDGDIQVPDIRGLTQAQKYGVYEHCFWRAPGVCNLPPSLDAAIFDQAVNDGITPAVEMLQRALNIGPHRDLTSALIVDGMLGSTTVSRATLMEAAYPGVLLGRVRLLAQQRYRAIVQRDPSQSKFLSGWLSRAEHLGDV